MWAPIKIGKGRIAPFFVFKSVREIWETEVLNCHLPAIETGWLVMVAKLFGKKAYLTPHTDLSFWPGWNNKLVDGLVFASQFIGAKLADGLIPYTKDYAKYSYFLKHFLKKVQPIYPPIKFETKIDKKMDGEIKKKTKERKYIIGFCGRIAKQKGLEVLIESSKYLDKSLGKNNWIVLLAGPKKVIGEKYFEYLMSKYKKTIEEKFIFLGSFDRDKLATFYRNIDTLVLPSDDRLESFGWVQIEAMSCGTPCVATNLPGMRMPVKKSGGGELFENKNSKDLAQKLIKVLKRGKKYYQKRTDIKMFDYDRSIDSYEKLFQKN